MSAQWGICAVALALAVVLGVVALVTQRRTARALDRARSESAALAERLEVLERRAREPRPAPRETTEHVITVLGDQLAHADEHDPGEPASRAVPAPLFADLVLREGVVQAASLAAGVRRALAPEQRHRIRLEMRREVKRARKQRRSEVRDARRHLAAQQRGDVARGESAA